MRYAFISIIVTFITTTAFVMADQVTLNPIEDAYIWQGNPNHCYGGEGYLSVGYDSGYISTLIEFDLSSYSGVIVNSASIFTYLSHDEGGYSNVNIGRNTAGWSEGSVTWNNRPAYNGYISVPYVPSANHWWEINVTSFIQDFVDGTYTNYGFRIGKGNSGFGYVEMRSKEDPDEIERPYLELDFNPNAIESSSLGNIKAAFK